MKESRIKVSLVVVKGETIRMDLYKRAIYMWGHMPIKFRLEINETAEAQRESIESGRCPTCGCFFAVRDDDKYMIVECCEGLFGSSDKIYYI